MSFYLHKVIFCILYWTTVQKRKKPECVGNKRAAVAKLYKSTGAWESIIYLAGLP